MTKGRPPDALRRLAAATASSFLLAACKGPQSWADPRGRDAQAVADLFWVMLAGAAVIWTLVIGLMVFAVRVRPGRHTERWARRFVLWGGIVAPIVILFALLVHGLSLMRDERNRAPHLAVAATGEQWWWRLTYGGPDGAAVPAPNELRLPVGRTVEMVLTADDVIHSFWAPGLGGKMDMIPGRVNRLRLTPTETGTFRGACAEFCGEAHAMMNFPVVVMEPSDFEAWLAAQTEPASPPATDAHRAGLALFLSAGCGGCHAIRGTEARGRVGPDLTHVGSRLTIGAGRLPMNADAMALWIARTDAIKPGVRMPSFGMLPDEEIALIANYLVSLK